MLENPTRQPHLIDPLPMDRIFRLANRLNLQLLLLVISYAAVMLSLIPALGWSTLLVSGIAALGIYHSRMRFYAANYYGQQNSLQAYCVWPVQSMLLIACLLAIGCVSWLLGFAATLSATMGIVLLFTPTIDIALLVTILVGSIPGCCLATVLAVSVVSKLGKTWLRLV